MSYATSSYNYQTFAKTSYIRNHTMTRLDMDSDNLTNTLKFNFSVNILQSGNYSLQASFYNDENEFVKILEKNVTLGIGNKSIVLNLSGKDVYFTYHFGYLNLSLVKLLRGNVTKDSIKNVRSFAINYTDFEKPALPDLKIVVNVTYHNNLSNITVNVSNIGTAGAFDINLDLFDNSTYENSSSLDFIDVNKSILLRYIASNTSINNKVTGIIDFNNFVDEKNETNNVGSFPPIVTSMRIQNISFLKQGRLLEVLINNTGTTRLTNMTWNVSFGDGITNKNTINLNLSSGELGYIYVYHNYTQERIYNVTVNITSLETNTHTTKLINTALVEITSFDRIDSDGKKVLFEATVDNIGTQTITINWSISYGDGNRQHSTINMNLTNSERAYIFAVHNYSSYENYTARINITRGSFKTNRTITFQIRNPFNISTFRNLTGSTNRIFEAEVKNELSTQMNQLNWTLLTAGTKQDAKYLFNLSREERIYIYIQKTYTPGQYNATISLNNTQNNNSRNIEISVD